MFMAGSKQGRPGAIWRGGDQTPDSAGVVASPHPAPPGPGSSVWGVVPSLPRHAPDQVHRVAASAASQSLERDPPENGWTLGGWRRGSRTPLVPCPRM